MKRILLSLFLLLAKFSFGQVSDTSFGKPVLWYHVSDPWAMFMGAEGPVFILYESGKMLFWKNRGYQLTKLDDDEKTELIYDLELTDTLYQKSRFFNATNPKPNGMIMATDNPTYTVFLNRDTLVWISVYGHISSKEYQKQFPKQVLHIHDFALNFDPDKSEQWLPDKIEVILSDYSYSPDTPIPWPKNWPDLLSNDSRKQGDHVTSIFLDKKYFGQLKKLIKKRREKQAFEINGQKFFIGYRFPLPGFY